MSALPPKADIRTWRPVLSPLLSVPWLLPPMTRHGLAIRSSSWCRCRYACCGVVVSAAVPRGISRVVAATIRISSTRPPNITSFSMSPRSTGGAICCDSQVGCCALRHSQSRPMKEADKTGTESGLANKLRQLGDIGRDPSRPQCLSAAFRFDERSAKLLDEGVSRRQIGKAPAIIKVTFLFNRPSMSRRKCSCFVKLNHPAVQCDIQRAHTAGKLDDVGIPTFVRPRLTATAARHV